MPNRRNQNPLPDQAGRDAAIRETAVSMCLEASAGTGKTTVLVGRIMQMLTLGEVRLDELVAITFTEKAAGELKIRLREQIEKQLQEASGEVEARLVDALASIERAQVSTIHSFAATLLRERPVEAGIDPGFEQLDELGAGILFDEVWDEWLGEQMQGGCPPLEAALRRQIPLSTSGPWAYSIRWLARDMVDSRDLVAGAEIPRPETDAAGLVGQYLRMAGELGRLAGRCSDKNDKGYVLIQQIVEHAISPPEAGSEVSFLRSAPAAKKVGTQKGWGDADACRRAKEIFGELQYLTHQTGSIVMADLVEWLRGFIGRYQDAKRERACLDFTDLLVLARDMLRDNRDVRGYFQRKFKRLLVDEFQDTDPLQVEIVFFLAEDGAEAANWREAALVPGKLFVVGDPKQSIYRFRRADVEMYEDAKQLVAGQGGLRQISTNFRSGPGVIGWVNEVFEKIMTPDAGQAYQAEYVPLEKFREAAEDRPAVHLIHTDAEDGTLNAAELRSIEGRCIAQTIIRAVEQEKWQVFDRRKGKIVPAQYRHIAILMPRRSGAHLYEDALQLYGVPFGVESGRGFYFRPEVSHLTNVLRAIDDPSDPAAVVAALRSPFFGLSDDDLFRFRQAGGRFNYLDGIEGGWDGFSGSFAILLELHEKRHGIAMHRLVEELFDRTRALVFYRLKPHGRQAVANLLKVVDQARDMETAGMTLRRFVSWIGDRENEAAAEADSPTAEPTDDHVQLLTMHKSKGLEFPIVVLANMNTMLRQRDHLAFDRDSNRMAVRFSQGLETAGASDIMEPEQQRLKAEEKRLLYVAATRARDHLIVPQMPKSHRQGASYADHLREACETEDADEVTIPVQELLDPGGLDHTAKTKALEPSKSDQKAKQAREQWIERRGSEQAKAAGGVRVSSASQHKREPEDVERSGRSDGARIGSAVHSVMQRVDLNVPGLPIELAREAAREQGIEELADTVAELAGKCLASVPARQAASAGWMAREMPFCLPLDDGFVEGYIDLIYEREGRMVIVDYKTDNVQAGQIDGRITKYRGQGAIYAEAVRRATGREVAEVVFVYARPGETRSFAGAELEAEGAQMLDEESEEDAGN